MHRLTSRINNKNMHKIWIPQPSSSRWRRWNFLSHFLSSLPLAAIAEVFVQLLSVSRVVLERKVHGRNNDGIRSILLHLPARAALLAEVLSKVQAHPLLLPSHATSCQCNWTTLVLNDCIFKWKSILIARVGNSYRYLKILFFISQFTIPGHGVETFEGIY